MPKTGTFLTGFILTFIGAIFFSTKAIIVKLAFRDTTVDAVTLLALRMAMAVPFYILIGLFASNRAGNVQFTIRQWFYVILLGLTGYYISSLCDFIGLQYVSAALERLILFVYPTIALVLNAIIFKKKVNAYQKFALFLTYTGIAIAYFNELRIDSVNPNFYYGSFFIFLCGFTFAIYLVGSGRLIPQVGAAKFTSYAMIAAAFGILLHYFISGRTVHEISGPLAFYGILLAIIATVIPTFIISAGIKKIGSNNVAIISTVGPVSTIIQAHYVLHETIRVGQIIGTALVIVGVLLIGWKGREI